MPALLARRVRCCPAPDRENIIAMRILVTSTCALLLLTGCRDKGAGTDGITKPVDTVASAKPSVEPPKPAFEVTAARCVDGTFIIPVEAAPNPSALASTFGSAAPDAASSAGDGMLEAFGAEGVGGFG